MCVVYVLKKLAFLYKLLTMNNHAADNVMMLTPSLCEACVLRQRKRSTKRNVAFCVFIVYNVLVLSLVLVMLWYLFDFRDRLDRTVKTVNSLQKHDDSVTVDINKPPVEESALAVCISTFSWLLVAHLCFCNFSFVRLFFAVF